AHGSRSRRLHRRRPALHRQGLHRGARAETGVLGQRAPALREVRAPADADDLGRRVPRRAAEPRALAPARLGLARLGVVQLSVQLHRPAGRDRARWHDTGRPARRTPARGPPLRRPHRAPGLRPVRGRAAGGAAPPAARLVHAGPAGVPLTRRGAASRVRVCAGPSPDPRRCSMRIWRAAGCLALAVLLLAAGAVLAQDSPTLPLGLDTGSAYIPDDNPTTPAKVALGKKFFWDKRWSANGTVACVSCHPPEHGWSDPRQFSISFKGVPTPRHAPTLVNRLFSDRQLWTGLRASLEEQALKDSNRTDEMVVKNLGSIPAYAAEFRRVFGAELHPDGVAKAIASYVRTIVSGNRPTTGSAPATRRPSGRRPDEGRSSSRARRAAWPATPASTSPTRATATSASAWTSPSPTSGATP